jgi:hypothetical protein
MILSGVLAFSVAERIWQFCYAMQFQAAITKFSVT